MQQLTADCPNQDEQHAAGGVADVAGGAAAGKQQQQQREAGGPTAQLNGCTGGEVDAGSLLRAGGSGRNFLPSGVRSAWCPLSRLPCTCSGRHRPGAFLLLLSKAAVGTHAVRSHHRPGRGGAAPLPLLARRASAPPL